MKQSYYNLKREDIIESIDMHGNISEGVKTHVDNHNQYRRVKIGDEYFLAHKLVSIAYDRMHSKGEVVHHLDFDKTNNSISNLVILKNGEHTKLHKEINRLIKEYNLDEEILTYYIKEFYNILFYWQNDFEDTKYDILELISYIKEVYEIDSLKNYSLVLSTIRKYIKED